MSFTENSDRWKQPFCSGGVTPTSSIMSLGKEKMEGGYTLYTIKNAFSNIRLKFRKTK
jgi:hypothetical protein